MCVIIYDSSDTAVKIVISVYMPFYQRGNHKQTEDFIERLDSVQGLPELYSGLTPVKLCGDFNAQLPKSHTHSLHTARYYMIS